MRHVYIIYSQFFDRDGKSIQVGGVETYIYNLCKHFYSANICAIIYQFANSNFITYYEGFKVVGVKAISKNYRKNSRVVANAIKKVFDYKNDILIFASEEYVVPFKSENIIAIQHGVSWDIPNNSNIYLNHIKNSMRAIIEYRNLKHCNKIVCVDYNFLNWYRATYKKCNYRKFYVIPNFCEISAIKRDYKLRNETKIIFARRFVNHRGALLFASVARKIIRKYPNVKICFAGTGVCEAKMKATLEGCSNVEFTTFLSDDSIKFHSNFDIAVVPTLGSEGTSLSLLEAMGAGCAVVCTNVGGMTNIILNRYNGIMISPSEEDLYVALKELIENYELRKFLSQKAVETVQHSFNKERWGNEWLNIVAKINKG